MMAACKMNEKNKFVVESLALFATAAQLTNIPSERLYRK